LAIKTPTLEGKTRLQGVL